jgi:hypothetical protein
MRHVRACWEIQLFRKGYALAGRSTMAGGEIIVPIHRADPEHRQRLMDRLRVHRRAEREDGRESTEPQVIASK